jgi:hypothetical protein
VTVEEDTPPPRVDDATLTLLLELDAPTAPVNPP